MIGAACSGGAQAGLAADGSNAVCISSVWQYPAYQFGAWTTCNSTNAGRVQWTGSVLQFCNGSIWTGFGGGGSVNLGTSVTTANPQISGDATSGFYTPAASTVAVVTAGVERMRVTATGLVGIGTTAPALNLEIGAIPNGAPASSGTSQTGGFRMHGASPLFNTVLDAGIGAGAAANAWLQATNATGLGTDYPLLLNPNGGNVGIGITTPSYPLTVVGNSALTSGANFIGEIIGNQSASTTGTFTGAWDVPTYNASGTLSFLIGEKAEPQNNGSGTVSDLIGLYAEPQNNSATGTTTNLVGLVAQPQNVTGTTSLMIGLQALPNLLAGSVTTMQGLYSQCANAAAAATVTNCYELYLDTPVTTGSITNKYGVYQTDANSKNYFAGNVGIETNAPAAALTVTPLNSASSNLATNFLAGSTTAIGTTAASYLYPFEFQSYSGGNNDRLQIAPYRRVAGSGWNGTAWRLQYAVDNSFTNGSLSYVEIGTDPNATNAGFISLGTEGSDRLVVTSTGFVGIGTTAPWGQLNLAGAGTYFGIQDSNSATANGLVSISLDTNSFDVKQRNSSTDALVANIWHVGFASNAVNFQSWYTNGTERMRIDTSGDVGIGTTSPFAILHAVTSDSNTSNNAAWTQDAIVVQNSNNTASNWTNIGFMGATSLEGLVGVQTAVQTGGGTADLVFSTDTAGTLTEKMRITSGGNVGIGTTAPAYTLHVQSSGSTTEALFGADASQSGLGLGTNSTNRWALFSDTSAAGRGFGIFEDHTGVSGTTGVRLYIAAGGAIGIGTTVPTSGFALDIDEPKTLYRGQSGGTTCPTDSTICVNYSGGSTQHAMEFTPAANTTNILDFFNAAGGVVGTISETATTVGFNSASDRRVKENIVPTQEGLATLMRIPVYNFNFITDPKKSTKQGFIAQALYPIYPEAVTTNGDNGIVPLKPKTVPWEVDYGRLTPLIVKSIQDQQAEIIALRDEVKKLELQNSKTHAP